MCLHDGKDLEPPAAAGGRGVSHLGLAGVGAVPVQAGGAAAEEEDDGADQGADGGDQDGPGGGAVVGAGTSSIVVNVGLDDAEEHEVNDQDDAGNQEGDEGHQGGEERPDDAGAESQQEADEVDTAGDRVEDHSLGQVRGGRGGIVGELGVVHRVHDVRGGVAQRGLGALVTDEGVSGLSLSEHRLGGPAAHVRSLPGDTLTLGC